MREAREALGITQKDLADRLAERGWKIHTTALTLIEKGERSLRVSQLHIMAGALNETPSGLLTDPIGRLADLRMETHGALVAARKELIRALGNVNQIVNDAKVVGDGAIAEAGLDVPNAKYPDWVVAQMRRYAASANQEHVYIVTDPYYGARPEQLTAIAEALISDLFEELREGSDGNFYRVRQERPPFSPPLTIA